MRHRQAALWIGVALGLLLGVPGMLAAQQEATPLATALPAPSIQLALYTGSCEQYDIASGIPLADPVAGDEESALVSLTRLDASLSALLAEPRVVVVRERENGDEVVVACVDVDGQAGPNGLAVALSPIERDYSLNGFVWLSESGSQTQIAVLLDQPAVSTAASAGDIQEVAVTLGGAAGEFAVVSERMVFHVNQPYRFVVTNDGELTHDFLIVPSSIEAGETVMDGSNYEALREVAIALIEADKLRPGFTATTDVVFTDTAEKGTLEMACYIPGHYRAGMYLPIEVLP